ncbi:MAG TPA: glycerophosphodiester phosphodiesterase [Jatrophihabitans sp.]|jgi:glycerophosphoryl diester phosphodiesterase
MFYDRRPDGLPLVSAHRGGPEATNAPNSLDAVRAATALGVDLVEFDVRVTADGRFVTWHDHAAWVEGKLVPVENLTYAQLRLYAPDAVDVKEVLNLLRGRARAHVDMKDARLEIELADLCEHVLGVDGFVLTTLQEESVRKVREARPHLHVALSLGRGMHGMPWWKVLAIAYGDLRPGRRVKHCNPTALAMNYRVSRALTLRWAHHHGFPVLVWTINRAKMMRKVARDPRYWAFTTDNPRLAFEVLRDEGRTKRRWRRHAR